MRRDKFEENWDQLKGKIQGKWSKFTDDDLDKINGKYEKFLSQLQKRYGYTKEEAEREMKNWQEGRQKKSKDVPQLWSEKKPSEIAAHEELAHEDKDPIYPFFWRTDDKKKKGDEPHRKDKKRKAS